MRIKYIIVLLMSIIIAISSALFIFISYQHQSKDLINALDQKLLTAVYFTRALVGEDYHDNIIDQASVSQDRYLEIVDTYNKLCSKLDLEYIWSLLQTEGGKIYFTSGTSTSKDINAGDYASFFELHSAPQLYEKAFETMETQYQINDDKWGRIRAVLVPFQESTHARKYIFGASKKMTEIDSDLRSSLIDLCIIGLIVMSLGIFSSLIFARYLSIPLENITNYAERTAKGQLTQIPESSGSLEMHSLAESIDKMSISLKRQLRKLRFTNKELKEIFYISSHDMKYPLMSIESSNAGLQEICKTFSGDNKQQAKEFLDNMKSGTEQLRAHLEGMLNISKISSSEIQEKMIDMNKLISELKNAFSLQLHECQGSIQAKSLPECYADKLLLMNVFSNLVDNCINYRSPQRKLKIEISGNIKDSKVVYCVKDNGIGIEEQFHENVFEIFRRIKPELNQQGHGLGLTIVVRIIERLDGQIWLDSEPDKGSKFYISLPLPKDK